SEEHTSELQSLTNLVCRLLLEKKKSTSGVGIDIGFGNLASKPSLRPGHVNVPRVAGRMASQIRCGVSPTNPDRGSHPSIDRVCVQLRLHMPADESLIDLISQAPFIPQRALWHMARNHLSTVGCGNHYGDLSDHEAGYLWFFFFFGSPPLGHNPSSPPRPLPH